MPNKDTYMHGSNPNSGNITINHMENNINTINFF